MVPSLPSLPLWSPLLSLRIQTHSDIFPFSAFASILLLEKCVFEYVFAELTLYGYITHTRTCYTYYTIIDHTFA